MAMVATPREVQFIMDNKAHEGIALITFSDTDKTFTEKYVRALIHKEFKERLCGEHSDVVPILKHLSSEFDGERAEYYCAYKVIIKETK